MHPLLPQLFFLTFLAPIILRLAVGGMLIYDAQTMWRAHKRSTFAVISGTLGALLSLGLFTQAAAGLAIIHIVFAHKKHKSNSVFANIHTLILAVSVLAFLFVTGAGGLAFDLPY